MRAAILQTVLAALVIAACLFVPAGTLHWPAAWAVVGMYGACFIVSLVVLDPELIRARAGREANAKVWDRLLTGVGVLLVMPLPLAIAAVDVKRYRWSPAVPMAAQAIATLMFLCGQGVAIWAARVNPFFVKFVRLQPERGQVVVSTGPYAYVRHPGYAGALAAQLAVPIVLGSLWAVIPVIAGSGAYAVRAVLEERLLQRELRGYREYAERVRWRLLPHLW